MAPINTTGDEATSPARSGRVPIGRVPLRSVALPTEHGGWSLTAEPALLGLLVAWSGAGLALGVTAMVAFVARTPLKLVLVDRFRHRWLDRTRVAAAVLALELVALGLLALYAALAGADGFWVPLVVALPLILLELWYDMRSRGRRLIPELAGSVGIGAVATAIALAAGSVSDRVAWGLWLVIGARSLAAIPYVRAQILRARSQRTKSRPGSRVPSDLAQLVAVSIGVAGWLTDLVPGPAVVVIAVLALINVVAIRRPPKPAVVIGIQQTVYGVAVIATTALAIGLR